MVEEPFEGRPGRLRRRWLRQKLLKRRIKEGGSGGRHQDVADLLDLTVVIGGPPNLSIVQIALSRPSQ